MAIAYVTSMTPVSTSATNTGLTGNTVTISGSDTLLLVWLSTNPAMTTLGMSFNGASMTLLATVTQGGGNGYLFALRNPTTGSAIAPIATWDSRSGFKYMMAAAYSGVNQAADPSNFSETKSGSDSSPTTMSLTTSATANSWVALFANTNNNTFTGHTNITMRQNVSGDGFGSGDSNGTVTASSTFSTDLSWSAGSQAFWGHLVEINPQTSTSVTHNATVLAITSSLPASTITTQINVTVSASVLGLTASLPAHTVTTNVAISPSPLTATFTLPALTILIADTTISASVLALTSSLPTRAIITDQLLTPSPLSSLFSLPSSTVTAVMNVSVAPSPLSLTASVPAATVSASVNLAPSPLALTSSRPASTVVTDQVLTPSPFTAAFSLPSASVSTIQNATLTPSPLSATFSLLAAAAIGALWENQSRESAASFTNETRQSSSWTNQDRSLS